MRALGAALVLLGAAGGYLLRRREQLLPVRLGRALLEDLAVLDYQIRFRRRPLPALLAGMEGLGARWLWQPLAEALERWPQILMERRLPRIWQIILEISNRWQRRV